MVLSGEVGLSTGSVVTCASAVITGSVVTVFGAGSVVLIQLAVVQLTWNLVTHGEVRRELESAR